VNTLNSLNGEAHTYGEAGLGYFEIITPDISSLDTIRSRIYDSVTSEKQKKQQQEVDNKPERPLPPPNSDFYQLAEALPPEELETLRQVRIFIFQ
jgi:hypothetical protein